MSASPPQFGRDAGPQNVAVIGVGLIGGSIAASLKKRGFRGTIVGCGHNAERIENARRSGLIDESTTELSQAVKACDLVLVCTPVNLIVDTVRRAAAHCAPGTLLTDAGSVKRSICKALADSLPRAAVGSNPEAATEFVGSHPMAGSEQRGYEHADPDLFVGRITVVTPLENSSSEALTRLRSFWSMLGSAVVEMSPELHDHAVAEISHLPHLVAAGLATMLSDENRRLAATGFRDTTRIAAGDPQLWSPILLSNADEVLRGLDACTNVLAQFREALVRRDDDALKKLLRLAKSKRDALG